VSWHEIQALLPVNLHALHRFKRARTRLEGRLECLLQVPERVLGVVGVKPVRVAEIQHDASQVALRVCVDHNDPFAALGQHPAEVETGRSLADPALVIK